MQGNYVEGIIHSPNAVYELYSMPLIRKGRGSVREKVGEVETLLLHPACTEIGDGFFQSYQAKTYPLKKFPWGPSSLGGWRWY